MNKYIKYKKECKLEYKKLFSKQDQLFNKKYPRLYAICSVNNILLAEVNYAWKRVKRLKIINKEQFENMTRAVIVAKQESWVFREGSRGNYAIKTFEKLNIRLI